MCQLVLSDRTLTLQRFPQTRDDSPLQAWDAADEYLLQQVADKPANGPTLLFNDTFGALTCGLYGQDLYSINDSLMSEIATWENLNLNEMNEGEVTFINSLAPLPARPVRVLIKIPKTLALLEHQLHALRRVVTAETQIIAAGKVKDIHTSTLKLFEQVLGATTTSLAVKKARLIFCQPTLPAVADLPQTTCWPLTGTPYQIHNHANVFSRSGLDIGTRFFMANLPENIEGEIADLGCGNGVIGLTALDLNPAAAVHFIDESWMAVASSRMNVELNRPDCLSRCHFEVCHSLVDYPSNSLHTVLCNPPFHQQNVLTDNIARQMFDDARRCLVNGGELRIVGNRHLDYHRKMKKLFGNCTTVAANQKFVILRSVKRRTRFNQADNTPDCTMGTWRFTAAGRG